MTCSRYLYCCLTDGPTVSLSGDQLTQLAAGDAESQNLSRAIAEAKIPAVVVDTEQDFIKLGLAQGIADSMSARYIKLDDLAARQPGRRGAPGRGDFATGIRSKA